MGIRIVFTARTGWLIVPLWVAAMGWLIAHDVWPNWTALEPPRLKASDWLKGEGRRSQYTISDESGPFGAVWTKYLIDDRSILRADLIWIDRLPLPIGPIRITGTSAFTVEGVLDEFTLRIEGAGPNVKLHGERFHSGFSFVLEIGHDNRTLKIPTAESGWISGAFHPFAELPNLQVGQSWRMQVVNPIAAITGIGTQFIPLMVRVTAEERLETPTGMRNCLVVETTHARAWIDARGVVLLQEMKIPMLGTMRIERVEEFDDNAYREASQASLRGRRP